jgi:hypothetical protein
MATGGGLSELRSTEKGNDHTEILMHNYFGIHKRRRKV